MHTLTLVKSILLEQLRNTHTHEDWYVPLTDATAGLNAQQANWKDHPDQHSIGQLVSHISFYYAQVLSALESHTMPDFVLENEKTFKKLSDKHWHQALKQLDRIQIQGYQLIEKATDEQITDWGSTVANLCLHTAYHTGQIIYIRKKNGWWKSARATRFQPGLE